MPLEDSIAAAGVAAFESEDAKGVGEPGNPAQEGMSDSHLAVVTWLIDVVVVVVAKLGVAGIRTASGTLRRCP